MELAAEAASVPAARRLVHATLRERHLAELDERVALLVSELVTNAVLHARSPLRLVLDDHGGCLRVEVSDGSPLPPVTKPFSERAATGRGMRLVELLSDGWGVSQTDQSGKTVWCEVSLPEAVR